MRRADSYRGARRNAAKGLVWVGPKSKYRPVEARGRDWRRLGEIRIGGFPDWCLVRHCETKMDCVFNGCARGHGDPPRVRAA